MSAALAQGTQNQNIMLTWLHGVLEVTIHNEGYNSSYIEIPGTIKIHEYERDMVQIRE